MKSICPIFALPCVLAVLLSCAAFAHAESVGAPARPQSVFLDDPAKGKDPFFPDSIRRRQQAPVAPGTNAPVAAPAVSGAQFLLKGVYPARTRPLALINNVTLGVGESAEVRAGMQTVKIRCREIRDRSVLIEIEGTGELRELKLREGL